MQRMRTRARGRTIEFRRSFEAGRRTGRAAPIRVAAVIGAAPFLALAGCQVLGPTAMGAGRGAYNEVLARTDAEQMLATVVRLRYADPIALLSVTNVTASLKFGANIGAEFGVGPQSNYSGNLVPLSGGASYEDNPTISYAPVDGQAFVREWLSPISLEMAVMLLQEGPGGDSSLLEMLVSHLNELPAPHTSSDREGNGFLRAAALLVELRSAGAAHWGAVPGTTDRFELVLGDRNGHTRETVESLLRALDIPPATGAAASAEGPIVRVPLVLGTRAKGERCLALVTRSIAQILRRTASAIEVPADHVATGVVAATPDTPRELDGIPRIRSSRNAPKNAIVAIRHRGWWYFIDDTDLASKRDFQRLEMLFMMRLSEAQRGSQTAPVLTIPVG